MESFQEMAGFYDSGNQLPFLGVVTWNDYDEGSEIETGIDNCVSSVTESLNGDVLSWSVQFSSSDGSESTIYNFVVYYSTDGTHLHKAGTVPQGTHQANLCTMLPLGLTVTMYVQAQGMPSIFNHISAGSVQWNGAHCGYSPP